eukprot:749744-Hanusia_phi.AAC.4
MDISTATHPLFSPAFTLPSLPCLKPLSFPFHPHPLLTSKSRNQLWTTPRFPSGRTPHPSKIGGESFSVPFHAKHLEVCRGGGGGGGCGGVLRWGLASL